MYTYRIESEHHLSSDWMPAEAFTQHYTDLSSAIATAIEGVDEPGEMEVRVVCVQTGEVAWVSTQHKYS
jgi:hypothetical protein